MASDLESVSKSSPNDDTASFDLLDVLIALASRKVRIAKITAVALLASLSASFLIPTTYKATARILPPQQQQSALAAAALTQVSILAGGVAPALGLKNPNDLYVGMLRSQSVADALIKRFDLLAVYDETTYVDSRRELEGLTTISSGRDGIITVEVEDTNPGRAADLANAYIEELDVLVQRLAISEASQRRVFFERQVRDAKRDLTNAELALRQVQEKTGLISLSDQGKALIESMARLRAEILAKEVELKGMSAFSTEDNPAYSRAKQQLKEMEGALRKLQSGGGVGDGNIFVPAGKIPESGADYLSRIRDLKYNEAIFEILAKQFELAKLDEAKEGALIQVVDKATVPEKKYRPKRTLITLSITLLAAVIGCILAVAQYFYFQNPRRAEQASEKFTQLRQLLRPSPKHQSKY